MTQPAGNALSLSLGAPCRVKVNNMSVMYKCWHALLLLLFVSEKLFMFAAPAWTHYADCRLYPGEKEPLIVIVLYYHRMDFAFSLSEMNL